MGTYRDQSSIFQVAAGNITRRATATVAADQDLFSIDGGRVLLLGFCGEVTVEIGAGSQDFAIHLDPDDGGTNVVLADATTPLAADGDVVGTMYTLNTTFAGDLVATLDYAANALLATPILLEEGDIVLDVTGTEAGSVKWEAVWVEWDAGGVLTAV